MNLHCYDLYIKSYIDYLLNESLNRNELSKISELNELWANAEASRIELVTEMLNAALKHLNK